MSPLVRFFDFLLKISFICPVILFQAESGGQSGINQDELTQFSALLTNTCGGDVYKRVTGTDSVILDEIQPGEEMPLNGHPGGQDAAPPIPVPYPQTALYLDLVSKVPITGDPIMPKNIRISGQSVSILPSGTVDIYYPDSPEVRQKIDQEIRRILVEDMTARLRRAFGSTADRQSAARLYADISVALAKSGVDFGGSKAGNTIWNYHYKTALEEMPQRNFNTFCADGLAETFAFALEAMTKPQ